MSSEEFFDKHSVTIYLSTKAEFVFHILSQGLCSLILFMIPFAYQNNCYHKQIISHLVNADLDMILLIMIWGGSNNSNFRLKAFFKNVEVKKNVKL